MSKTFTVVAEMTVSLETEVEAETLQDAWKLLQKDNEDFIRLDCTNNAYKWDIYRQGNLKLISVKTPLGVECLTEK